MDDEEQICNILGQFREMLEVEWADDCSPGISTQLKRKLLHLVSWLDGNQDLTKIVCRISSVFHRLMLELVQAHYNTTQQERKFVLLVERKNGSVRYPELTDFVIERLVKLYKAAGACADTSFERKALIMFLLQEIRGTELEGKYNKKQIELVVQTLYMCSCFEVTKIVGGSSRFRLKEDLNDANELRQFYDAELIKLAQLNDIRLPPESWLLILYTYPRSFARDLSHLQSLIDRHKTPVTVTELKAHIEGEDRFHLSPSLADLQHIENTLNCIMDSKEEVPISSQIVLMLLAKLLDLKRTFTIRQSR